ncbi:M13 family metallopeptidase [Flavobacterium selenitireducens]|uniref:M13 family metallopeptidase n=1 Tax=Flavobacterium selenitireducens TaxID=2722704 RepID=UPI00168AD2D6|nr:M13 family metallopeptidase [Flavobacterium selenitireducens]MBD3581719.1 M13 family metallopeptidase [Flavobacterium selenitireducens]
MTNKTLIRIPLIAGAALFALASCQSDKKQEELTSGIILKNMDTLVKPGDNFDAFVNGAWVKKTSIPADKAAYGVSAILDDEAQENVKKIIEASSKGKFDDGSNEQKIGDFYNSYMDQKTRDSKGISPLKPELDAIDAIKNYDELAAYFGKANAEGGTVPFAVGVTEDFKDPTKYMLYTWQSGIGLPEREYYFLTDAKSQAIRTKYVAHIAAMLKFIGDTKADENAKKIMALETAIASKHLSKELTRDVTKMYNPQEIANLKTIMPNFNFTAMLDNAKIKGQKTIIFPQVEFMRAIDGIVKSTPLDTWKTWLKWNAIHDSATVLTADIDTENFNFYGKTLYGTEKQREQWRRGVGAVNNNLGEIVGEVYVKNHFSPEAKKRMEELVQNLLKAYEVSIKELTWMTPETKKQALDKLSKFTPKVGYPDKWKDYSALKVVKGDLFGNMQRSTEFEYNRQIAKLGKKVDRSEWGMTPQTVNAYYNPSLNEIVFPAAILQPPFFDLNADDATNYGSIGAVIGHEIGHGFDDQGSSFDGDGVLRNWWTEKDHAAFKERTGALVSQYNEFNVFPDLKVNGAFTLGENIGDLGGVTIAYRAYKLSLNGKPSKKMDGYTGEQRFFIGYAQSWLEKSREESLRNQVASDPHSPAHFRVNGIVRNIPEFYEAFNVKAGDSLYLAPEKRVKIW